MDKTRLRFVTLLWALCIMTAAMIRGYRVGSNLQTTGFAHVALHIGVFAVLGFLMMLSYDTPRIRLMVVVAGIILGLSTELYEHLAFHGEMEFGDVLVDALGILGGAAARFVRRPSML